MRESINVSESHYYTLKAAVVAAEHHASAWSQLAQAQKDALARLALERLRSRRRLSLVAGLSWLAAAGLAAWGMF